LLATGGLAVAVPLSISSNAAAAPPHLEHLLESLWTKVFSLPIDENPFTGGDHCLMLSDPRTDKPVLAPFATPSPAPPCSVTRGTKLFVTGWSSECSNVEGPPFHGDGETELRACARADDAGLNTPVVTFDGRRVQMKEVETALMEAPLPEGNIFDQPAGTPIESVGHGWVALVPLTPGQHTVTIHTTGTYVSPPGPLDLTTTTTIYVTR
jgi:hypothetical protein